MLTVDTGSVPRPSSFRLDPDLPSGFGQQSSAATYSSVSVWDRGHLVASNHMDYNESYIRRANYMTNIVPQVGTFNRGVWKQAEEVAECFGTWRRFTSMAVWCTCLRLHTQGRHRYYSLADLPSHPASPVVK